MLCLRDAKIVSQVNEVVCAPELRRVYVVQPAYDLSSAVRQSSIDGSGDLELPEVRLREIVRHREVTKHSAEISDVHRDSGEQLLLDLHPEVPIVGTDSPSAENGR